MGAASFERSGRGSVEGRTSWLVCFAVTTVMFTGLQSMWEHESSCCAKCGRPAGVRVIVPADLRALWAAKQARCQQHAALLRYRGRLMHAVSRLNVAFSSVPASELVAELVRQHRARSLCVTYRFRSVAETDAVLHYVQTRLELDSRWAANVAIRAELKRTAELSQVDSHLIGEHQPCDCCARFAPTVHRGRTTCDGHVGLARPEANSCWDCMTSVGSADFCDVPDVEPPQRDSSSPAALSDSDHARPYACAVRSPSIEHVAAAAASLITCEFCEQPIPSPFPITKRCHMCADSGSRKVCCAACADETEQPCRMCASASGRTGK